MLQSTHTRVQHANWMLNGANANTSHCKYANRTERMRQTGADSNL
jgi:hypothetical protein